MLEPYSSTERAVHFCFGNYGGQTIQKGKWKTLIDFLNGLHCDHLVLELAHRPVDDLEALRDIDPKIGLGIGVIDVKVSEVESPDEVALGSSGPKKPSARFVKICEPHCGFWMNQRSIAHRKMVALAKGRRPLSAHHQQQ